MLLMVSYALLHNKKRKRERKETKISILIIDTMNETIHALLIGALIRSDYIRRGKTRAGNHYEQRKIRFEEVPIDQ